jgi:hypothetical protein
MSRSVAIACFLAGFGFAQPVTVQPTSIAGIEIVGPRAPNFGSTVAEVVGNDQPRGFLAWLPYALVVKNKGTQPIVALAVLWTCQRDTASEPRRCYSVSPAWFTVPKLQLPAKPKFFRLREGRSRKISGLEKFGRRSAAYKFEIS